MKPKPSVWEVFCKRVQPSGEFRDRHLKWDALINSQDKKQYKKKPGKLFIFFCCCTFSDDPVDFDSDDLLDEVAERGKMET